MNPIDKKKEMKMEKAVAKVAPGYKMSKDAKKMPSADKRSDKKPGCK